MGRADEPPDDPLAVLAEARPGARSPISRQIGLRGVLSRVLGDTRPLPRLGRWVVERRIGAGGMGAVYRAHDPDTGVPVAIKVLGGSDQRERFAREAALLRAVDHPRVVRYLGDGRTEDGEPFLVMAWLDGIDLAARLRRGPLDVAHALRIVRAAAEGLGAAHRAGVVHRDVKPSNLLLVGDDDDVRVVDFGVARGALGDAPLTVTGEVLGTPAYMAPEQIRGGCDVRTDVYGLGATLFEALVGHPPFRGDQAGALLIAVLHDLAPRVAELRPDVPAAVDALVARLLAKDVEDRPRDMDAVIAEVSGCLADLGAPARRAPVSRAERARRATDSTARAEPDPAGPLGRARPLGLLVGALQAAAEDERAVLVSVSGPSGSGRSLLVEAAAGRLPDARWLRTAGTREAMGVPFGGLRALVAGEPGAQPLRAALDAVADSGVDPAVGADRVRLQWLDLVERWLGDGPVVVVLDDAEWLDLASLRLVDAALRLGVAAPIAVVAVTRGAEPPPGLGGALDADQRVSVGLRPLAPLAVSRLVARLAPGASADDRAHVVRLADGLPGQAVALASVLAAGGVPGGSVAEAAWARLEALDPDSRRLLRAASIAAEAACPELLAELVGESASDGAFQRRLDRLVADGLLRRSGRTPWHGADGLAFVSEGVRLAAYQACPDDDRRRGHEGVARWLGAAGAPADAVLARHLAAAGDGAAASRVYLGLARAAVGGGDATLAERWIDRAQGVSDDAVLRGEVEVVRAAAHFWSGRIDDASAHVDAGLAALPPGSRAWLDAANLGVTAAGQRGDHARVEALADAIRRAAPADAEARSARVVGLCRAVTQLVTAGRGLGGLAAALEGLENDASMPDARAWLGRVRGARAAPAFDASIDAFVAAHRAHVEAGDTRSAAQIGLYLGSLHVWAGAWDRAAEVTDDAIRAASRLGATYIVTWGRYVEGKRLAETAPFDDAAAALDEVAAQSASSPRILAGALLWSAIAALRAGRLEQALQRAERAQAVPAGPLVGVPAWAAAELARVGLGRSGDPPPVTAWDPAQVEFGELPALARATRLVAVGDEAGAAATLAPALAAVEARAASLTDPLRRNRYLEGPWLVSSTRRLAARLGAGFTAPGG